MLNVFNVTTSLHKTLPLRILVVDQDAQHRRWIERTLIASHHTCVGVERGEDALVQFEQTPFDLVLIEIMLPGINGFETVIRMRKLREEWVPIVFMSALCEPFDIVAALDAGGDDYLVKPINSDILSARIGALHRIATGQNLAREQSEQLWRYFAIVEREKEAAKRLFSRLRRDEQLSASRADVSSLSADQFSGDLVAVQESPDGRVLLVLADAMGHGLLAAAQLFPLIEMFNEQASRGFAMPSVIARASGLLCKVIPIGNFISACFVTIDPHTGLIEVWNFGMPDVLLLETDGRIAQRFASQFMPLGIMEMLPEQLEPDRSAVKARQFLFLHSDGLIEARRRDDERFGWARLDALLPDAVAKCGADGGSDHIVAAMQQFLEGGDAEDDVTVCLYPIPADAWFHLRDHSPPPPPNGALQVCGVSLTVRLGARELVKPDPVADLMTMLRDVSDIGQRSFEQLFAIARQLARNALDWGVLGLDPSLGSAEREIERWKRLRGDINGSIEIAIALMRDEAGKEWWEIRFSDSGTGFDTKAIRARHLTRSAGHGDTTHAAWHGLDIVHGLCGTLEFSEGGRQVRALLPA